MPRPKRTKRKIEETNVKPSEPIKDSDEDYGSQEEDDLLNEVKEADTSDSEVEYEDSDDEAVESFDSDLDESDVKSVSDDLDEETDESEADSSVAEDEEDEEEVSEADDLEEPEENDSEHEKTESEVSIDSYRNISTPKETTNPSTSSTQPDEYADYDSSDEEDIRNTVGNIPMNWYDDYKHLGYDWDGNKIIKPETGDQLDNFLKRIEDPDFWRTVKDPQTGQDVVLSQEDIEIIKRIKEGKIPDVSFDDHAPWIDWFSREVLQTPLRSFPEHKRSFLPSKSEALKVSKLVHALKMGWIKTRAEQEKLRAKKEPQFYMLWQSDDQAEEMRRIHKHIPAPKRLLPGHAESYNPPPEYLFDSRELKEWNKLEETPWKRKLHFVPKKYESLRQVPAYPRYIKERFLRCLDLYLCPRAIKMRLTINPEELVPKLPSPKDLQPFPTNLAVEYKGHEDFVRCISVDKTGQFLVSGSDDKTIRIWEVNTSRCLKTIQTEGTVRSVEFCPNLALTLILVASDKDVLLINPNVGDFLACSKTDGVLKEKPQSDVIVSERIRNTVRWEDVDEGDEYDVGFRMKLKHFREVTKVTWHGKGDYFASVMPEGQNRSVVISQVSKRRSQLPFTKSKGLIQTVLFHPTKPFLFVATQRHVRIYDLMKQTIIKKLMTNSKWISSMAVHPGGDNLIVGTYDRKTLWFDLDLSTKPYQTLRLHGNAIRDVAFHRRYPLFASGSDDRSVIVSHGMVYNDLLQNPLIVPLKRLQDHEGKNDFGVFAVEFHPLQPWVFSAGADGTIKLYSN